MWSGGVQGGRRGLQLTSGTRALPAQTQVREDSQQPGQAGEKRMACTSSITSLLPFKGTPPQWRMARGMACPKPRHTHTHATTHTHTTLPAALTMAAGGRFFWNLARRVPTLPWARVTCRRSEGGEGSRHAGRPQQAGDVQQRAARLAGARGGRKTTLTTSRGAQLWLRQAASDGAQRRQVAGTAALRRGFFPCSCHEPGLPARVLGLPCWPPPDSCRHAAPSAGLSALPARCAASVSGRNSTPLLAPILLCRPRHSLRQSR